MTYRHQCRACCAVSHQPELCPPCAAERHRIHVMQDIVDGIGFLSMFLFVALMIWAFGQ